MFKKVEHTNDFVGQVVPARPARFAVAYEARTTQTGPGINDVLLEFHTPDGAMHVVISRDSAEKLVLCVRGVLDLPPVGAN